MAKFNVTMHYLNFIACFRLKYLPGICASYYSVLPSAKTDKLHVYDLQPVPLGTLTSFLPSYSIYRPIMHYKIL